MFGRGRSRFKDRLAIRDTQSSAAIKADEHHKKCGDQPCFERLWMHLARAAISVTTIILKNRLASSDSYHNWGRSDVEPEIDDVAVFHYVFLAFKPCKAFFARRLA